MKAEKAVKVLRTLREFHNGCTRDCEALDMGIKALEAINLIRFTGFTLNKLLEGEK